MKLQNCDQCQNVRQITHRIKSDILRIEVCYECGVKAEIIQRYGRQNPGAMTITLIEDQRDHLTDISI